MKKLPALLILLFLFMHSLPPVLSAEETPGKVKFSPQGEVKDIQQVTAVFPEAMIPFGDPSVPDPFTVSCPEKGRGRWLDSGTWAFDFDRKLPAGIRCTFSLKPGLKTLAGKSVPGPDSFSFSTGGPAVRRITPWEGNEWIDERQMFVLTLDTGAVESSVVAHTRCIIEGINEKVGVTIIRGKDRETAIAAASGRKKEDLPIIVAACARSFPPKAKVKLVWGAGIESTTGVATSQDQTFEFRARAAFTATVSCRRENPRSDCIPILPVSIHFSSPVPIRFAEKIIMKDASGKIIKGTPGEQGEDSVSSITFRGPFQENASYRVEVPKNIRDDSGRELSNFSRFPFPVKTGSYPPIAKFSARFGIIEKGPGSALPVTVRNIEKEIAGMQAQVNDAPPAAGDAVKGTVREINRETQIIQWLRKVSAAGRKNSIFDGSPEGRRFTLPKPHEQREFEVVGIPLEKSGFYVVELQSRILGSALLNERRTFHVPTAALVTNLSVSFKWAKETSLVWVTTLDTAEPVAHASVSVRNCRGGIIWEGKTNEDGIALVKRALPDEDSLPRCPVKTDEDSHYDYSQNTALSGMNGGLFIFAKTADDLSFSHSSWDRGIESWRFNLFHDYSGTPISAHSVFDRSLLRAGETLHMKHVIRKKTSSGFSLPPAREMPDMIEVRHRGSDQTYEFPVVWDGVGIAETEWKIPRDAKLGFYDVSLAKKAGKKGTRKRSEEGQAEGISYSVGSGTFRVEEFRIPLMKGIIQSVKKTLVNDTETDVDLFVSYLSGGGASHAPVRLRSTLIPKSFNPEEYSDFIFANGTVREGIVKHSSAGYDEGDDSGDDSPPVKAWTFGVSLELDGAGALRTKIDGIPRMTVPHDLLAEIEFRDANGEVQTASSRIPAWPSGVVVGINADSSVGPGKPVPLQAVVLDLMGKPLRNREVSVEFYTKKTYSHRKRLIGGFYAYEHATETRKGGNICRGVTDERGLLFCEVKEKASGNLVLVARTRDDAGNESVSNRDVWIADREEWWFDVSDNDRMDVIPEKKKYDPGDVVRAQVRMPFREASALVTIEREGVIDAFVRKLSGTYPVVEVPVKGSYAPNIFISVLAVRGRLGEIKPGSQVDLGRPAFKLGITEVSVGWKAHELNVSVEPDKNLYRIRETARTTIRVKTADGRPLPKGSEIAVAVVDEGLLELMQNKSWQILQAMMNRRGNAVKTSTASMQVVGKRHFGLKAVPHGGGGGKQVTRELFDTLLLWKGRVALDEKGEATVSFPLNDSLTSFRITAVASGGTGLFGTGHASIRTTQDLMLLPGLPPFVRESDRFRAGFTARNTTGHVLETDITASVTAGGQKKDLDPVRISLKPGEAKEIGWQFSVPSSADRLRWEAKARASGKEEAADAVTVTQSVMPAVPVRAIQAALARLAEPFHMEIEKPEAALAGKGGVTISLTPSLSKGTEGVMDFMREYPYTCLEQRISRAVALKDQTLQKAVIESLPAYLDEQGLLKYFPLLRMGSDVLTSYMLAISSEAGWDIPQHLLDRMQDGLRGFIEGKVIRSSSLQTADLSIRKLSALAALSARGKADPQLVSVLRIEPNLWPTSSVIDWMTVLRQVPGIPKRDQRLTEAAHIMRSRIHYQGTTLLFSTEKNDSLWWLMTSADTNALRAVILFLDDPSWKNEVPKMMLGALARQRKGSWGTTTANAWGIVALDKFGAKFESPAIWGTTAASSGATARSLDWASSPDGGTLLIPWPQQRAALDLVHKGGGIPWAFVRSTAAIPLREDFSSGFRITKNMTPVYRKHKGKWSEGDVVKVRIEMESQSDMTWVVVHDPVPAGASVIGTGLGRDSAILSAKDSKGQSVWPAFEERAFDSYRAYYEFVPRGKWFTEYTVRLNTEGAFRLPPTRVEALYHPEMFAEIPNRQFDIQRNAE